MTICLGISVDVYSVLDSTVSKEGVSNYVYYMQVLLLRQIIVMAYFHG